jgi:hypothetical protein
VSKTKKEGTKELKEIDKALSPVIGKFNPEIDLTGRHAFVILTLAENDDGMTMSLHKVDLKTSGTADPIKALMDGGAAGFVSTSVMSVLKECLEEIGNKAIMAQKFTGLIDGLLETAKEDS